jgi:peptide deformylase
VRGGNRDTRITVSRAEDKIEYDRQFSYINQHRDCLSVPPRRLPLANREPRVTVSCAEDETEYDRQRAYIKNNPGCLSVPPRAKRYKGTK